MQYKAIYLLFCNFILHVSGVNHTHHQYTKLQLQPPVLFIIFVQLPPSNVAKLPKNMTSTGGCSYSFVYS